MIWNAIEGTIEDIFHINAIITDYKSGKHKLSISIDRLYPLCLLLLLKGKFFSFTFPLTKALPVNNKIINQQQCLHSPVSIHSLEQLVSESGPWQLFLISRWNETALQKKSLLHCFWFVGIALKTLHWPREQLPERHRRNYNPSSPAESATINFRIP